MHQDRRLGLKRIVRESAACGIGMQHIRNVLDGLLSGICRLRHGQGTYPEDEDQLPMNAINAVPGDSMSVIPHVSI